MESSPSSRKARKSFMSTNTTSSPRSKKSQNTLQFDVSSESESDASERTPKSRQHQSVVLNDSDSEENVVFSSKKSRTSRPIEIDSDSDIVLASSRKIPHSSSIIHDSDSDDVVARPAKRVFTSSAATVDSDSDVVSTRPTKKRRISPVLEDYDSDIAIGHPAKSRLMSSARSTRLDNRSQEVVPIARLTRRQTKVMNEALDNREDLSAARNVDLDESDDDEPPRSSFRRVIQEQVTPEKEKLTRRDRDDLEEDLEFLESKWTSVQARGGSMPLLPYNVQATILWSYAESLDARANFLSLGTDTPPSTRRPSKQSAKQKALEALKKRRSKHQGAEKGTASFNGNMNNSEEEEDSNEHDEEDEEGGSDGNFDEYTNIATEDLDQDEDDFVVEDENSMMGAPVELPVQFSRYQTMKAGDLFKFAVEWMVQKKLNPAFETDDEIYRFSFARLDDFVKGLGGSKYQSSVWTPNFSKSLNSRPVLEDHQFTNSGLLHDRCDACNRSGHPATWEVRFTGNCYDRNSLEEDSDDDSDDESPSVPSATTTYYIGK